ncbi:opioid growth factor receptor-related protein [Inhella crocodyli]|nr:opioid growth factor receptor-related protein [Inhella crocodyli]
MSQALLSFLRGEGPDGAGRTLNEVLGRDDDWWEAKHDFVQWLFPNPLPSRANPRAPLLSDAVIEVVQRDAEIQANVDRALLRFTQFLGFELTDEGYVLLESWPTAKKRWFSRDTHNGMRLTRTLKFLTGIGREEQAEVLVAALLKMCRDEVGCGITPMTRSYWRSTLDMALAPVPRTFVARAVVNA